MVSCELDAPVCVYMSGSCLFVRFITLEILKNSVSHHHHLLLLAAVDADGLEAGVETGQDFCETLRLEEDGEALLDQSELLTHNGQLAPLLLRFVIVHKAQTIEPLNPEVFFGGDGASNTFQKVRGFDAPFFTVCRCAREAAQQEGQRRGGLSKTHDVCGEHVAKSRAT